MRGIILMRFGVDVAHVRPIVAAEAQHLRSKTR
jgi:hypothetical protein